MGLKYRTHYFDQSIRQSPEEKAPPGQQINQKDSSPPGKKPTPGKNPSDGKKAK